MTVGHLIHGRPVPGRAGASPRPRPGDRPGDEAGRARERRRGGGGRRLGRRRLPRLGGDAAGAPRPGHVPVQAARRGARRRARRPRHVGARQGPVRRAGVHRPRPRDRGVRLRDPAPPQGRVLRGASGPGIDSYTLRQPLGVCAGITPFNFPAMVPMWMFPVAIALRQHLRPQAFGARPVDRPAARGAAHRGRAPARRPQRGERRQGGGRRAPRPPARRRGQLRRLDAGRRVHLPDRLRDGQARPGARRREEPHGRDAGRGSRPGRGRAHGRRLRLGGRALHGDLGGRRGRRRRGGRPGRRACRQASRRLQDRARDRAEAPTWARSSRGSTSRACAATSRRACRRARRWSSTAARCAVPGDDDGFFLGACLFDHVTPEMRSTARRSSARCSVVVRVPTVERALQLVERARVRQRHVHLHPRRRRRPRVRRRASRPAWSA